jgi:hypothetical protein
MATDRSRNLCHHYDGLAGQTNPAVREAVRQRLLHWQKDPDLVGLREGSGLIKLSPTSLKVDSEGSLP